MPDESRRTLLADKLRLYLVADPELAMRPLSDDVAAALGNGVTAVQLRAKRLTDRETFTLASSLRELCRAAGALFFVNDRVDIALACDADGVHLGVDDLPLEAARRLVGPDAFIGYSPETDEQTQQAVARGTDYLGVGPVFGTGSKADAGPAIGLDTIRRRTELAAIPMIGIGGIDAGNAAQVIAAGAIGVAVVSAILHAADPARAARQLAAAVRAVPASR